MEHITEMLKGILEGCVLEIIDRNDTYGYEATRENTLIYYKPEQIYDTENRYYKIYTDEV